MLRGGKEGLSPLCNAPFSQGANKTSPEHRSAQLHDCQPSPRLASPSSKSIAIRHCASHLIRHCIRLHPPHLQSFASCDCRLKGRRIQRRSSLCLSNITSASQCLGDVFRACASNCACLSFFTYPSDDIFLSRLHRDRLPTAHLASNCARSFSFIKPLSFLWICIELHLLFFFRILRPPASLLLARNCIQLHINR